LGFLLLVELGCLIFFAWEIFDLGSGASGRSLVDDFRQALDDNTVKIKSYNDRIDLNSEGQAKVVFHLLFG
jgi:hypothetical protein